jgi:hypothetical protein
MPAAEADDLTRRKSGSLDEKRCKLRAVSLAVTD